MSQPIRAIVERADLMQHCLIVDAIREGTAATWDREADEFAAARPRRPDFTGNSTPQQLVARYDELTEIAQACPHKAELCRAGELDEEVDPMLEELAS